MVLLLCAVGGKAQIPAFPGAQGGGAAAVGGRGGIVYEITTTADNGGSCSTPSPSGFTNCSFRQCLQATGARTCVFRTTGLFTFNGRVTVNAFVTVAGQTTPGGGIVIGGPNQTGEQIFVNSHDVIVRYLTYDGNNPNTATGPDTGTVCCEMASGNVFNVVWDHISTRWAGNKAFPAVANDLGPIHNTTLQWILMYEPNVCHPVGFGTLYVSTGNDLASTDDDNHHSMFINVGHRLPLNQSGLNTRNVNNIIYNYGQFAVLSMGGVQGDFIGNKYVDGTSDPAGLRDEVCGGQHFHNGNAVNYGFVHTFIGEVGNTSDDPTGNPGGNNEGHPTFYLLNNIARNGGTYQSTPNVATNAVNDAVEKNMTNQGYEGGDRGGAMPASWFRNTPLPTQTFPITANDVNTLDSLLPSLVGNSRRLGCDGSWISNRDSQDTRVINQYLNRAGGNTFFGQFTAPAIPGGTPCASSQHDGIPDQWKTANGYSTTNPNLRNQVLASGYTVLETYLNGTGVASPPPVQPTLTITGVGASNITSTSATISWTTNNPSNSTVNYGPCNVSLSTPTNQTQVTFHVVNLTGLTPSQTYNFNVESFDSLTTLTSTTAQFTTLPGGGGGNPTVPASPVLLSAAPAGVQISWTKSSSTGVTSYKVYRSGTSGSGYVQKAQVTGTGYVDTAVTSGQTLFYVVTAVAPNDTTPESVFSNQVQVVVP